MILTFSEPKFEQLILDNIKETTFREDKTNRWYVGRIAQLWMHNPRNVRLNPHHIKDDVIIHIDYVTFIPIKGIIRFYEDEKKKFRLYTISEKRNRKMIERMAKLDGFDNWEEMKQWFINKDYTSQKGYNMKRLWFNGSIPI